MASQSARFYLKYKKWDFTESGYGEKSSFVTGVYGYHSRPVETSYHTRRQHVTRDENLVKPLNPVDGWSSSSSSESSSFSSD